MTADGRRVACRLREQCGYKKGRDVTVTVTVYVPLVRAPNAENKPTTHRTHGKTDGLAWVQFAVMVTVTVTVSFMVAVMAAVMVAVATNYGK